MSDIVRPSRSPFYWRVQPSVPLSTVASTTTQVFIWNGLEANIPATPKYTFVKTPLGGSNLIVLDLAQLVNDYLEVTYDGTYSTDCYYLFASTIFYDAANVQIGSVVELPENYVFSKGFGFFNNGVNPKFKTESQPSNVDPYVPAAYAHSNQPIFRGNASTITPPYGSWSEMFVPESEPIQFPAIVGSGDSIYVKFYNGVIPDSNTEFKQVILSNDGTSSDQYIQYADNIPLTTQPYFDPKTQKQWDDLVEDTWDSTPPPVIENKAPVGNTNQRDEFWCPENKQATTWMSYRVLLGLGVTKYIKVNYIPKDKFMPYKVTFINSFGVLEDLWFTGSDKSEITVNGDTFKRNLLNIPTSEAGSDPSYNVDAHQYVTFGEQGRKSYTLNTGFIPEEFNSTMTELMLSQKIWITKWRTQYQRDNPTLFDSKIEIEPVVLKSKQLAYKTHVNEKVINYTVQFQSAHDEVNQVR